MDHAVMRMQPSQIPAPKLHANVLVLHVGGTIGMKASARGFVPEREHLQQLVSAHPQLRDPAQSGLQMPMSPSGVRVAYEIVEYDPLLDSSNMDMRDWAKIAEDIATQMDAYDGFVILHGTDTMAYSASALSFLLENLAKPVILTGSQLPLSLSRNDAVDNLQGALYLAGHLTIPEVCLYFRSKLFRGNRAQKQDARSFDAFVSGNFPPLVHMGVDIEVRTEIALAIPTEPFRVHTKMSEQVAALRLFPGITPEILANFLRPPLRGLVIETYGAGNGPDKNAELLRVLREATDRGVVIVNCTQCQRGRVTTSYATGRALADAGVISGADMTPEASLAKLSFLLGQHEDHAAIATQLQQNLRGELTQ